MPTFKTFISNRPEIQVLPIEEQKLEYEQYIADALESIAD
jgi:hypothetical protein